jgi:2-(1,2-epoxy-1,2-dihydrophenyl)acetyl-CoA isomerase
MIGVETVSILTLEPQGETHYMSTVIEDLKDGVFTLILNRPDKKNAMSLELLKDLCRSLRSVARTGASIVVIRGAGSTFSSGGDVIEFRDSDEPGVKVDAMADFLNRSIMTIRSIPAIAVSVMEGLAVGAGLSLSLACDLSIAARNAVINMGYRRIGLTPDGGASIFLPRLIGMKRFNELYFLSRNVAMEEAEDIGLVNMVVDEGELESRLRDLIDGLKTLPMETTLKAKELVNLSVWQGLGTHLDKERRYVSEFSAEPAFQERLRQLYKKK